MARYTGPTTRINRRFGMALFPPTKAMERKAYPPGVHGPRLRRKVSEYGAGLNEKQKLRFVFGLQEGQFRRTFERAKAMRGRTGEQFLQMLETRLDSVVYHLGFSKTRRQARQFVGHGHVLVNGHKVDIPSYSVQVGDEIEIRNGTSSRQQASRAMEETRGRPVPAWLARSDDAFRGNLARLPAREEMEQGINEQLIVEFYSR